MPTVSRIKCNISPSSFIWDDGVSIHCLQKVAKCFVFYTCKCCLHIIGWCWHKDKVFKNLWQSDECVCVLLSQMTHTTSQEIECVNNIYVIFTPSTLWMCIKGTSIIILWQMKDNMFSCHIVHNSTIEKVIMFLFFWSNKFIYLKSNWEVSFFYFSFAITWGPFLSC